MQGKILKSGIPKKNAVLVFVSLMILYASSYFQRTAIPGTIFNELSADYGFSAIQIAGMGVSFIWVYSLSQLVVGMLADKYSGLRIVTWAGLLFAAGVILFPFSCGNLTLMYLCRTLTGLGASSMYLSLIKETDRMFGRANYSVLIGIVYFVGYSGGLFGTLPYEQLAARYHWRTVLIWIGVISVCLYAAFLLAKRTIPAPKVANMRISFRPLLVFAQNKYTWILLFCATVNFCCYYTIQTIFGKKFLQDFAGMSSQSAAAVIFSLTLVCMVTLLCGGIFIKLNHNRRKPQMVLSVCAAFLNTVMMFMAVCFRWPAGFFAAGYLIYAFASGFSVAFSMTCQEVNSRDTMAQAAGVINMCNYMAVAVFSLLIGKLLDSFVPASSIVKGSAVVYPASAYQLLFGLLLIPVTISLILVFRLPETRGHYLHQKLLR